MRVVMLDDRMLPQVPDQDLAETILTRLYPDDPIVRHPRCVQAFRTLWLEPWITDPWAGVAPLRLTRVEVHGWLLWWKARNPDLVPDLGLEILK